MVDLSVAKRARALRAPPRRCVRPRVMRGEGGAQRRRRRVLKRRAPLREGLDRRPRDLPGAPPTVPDRASPARRTRSAAARGSSRSRSSTAPPRPRKRLRDRPSARRVSSSNGSLSSSCRQPGWRRESSWKTSLGGRGPLARAVAAARRACRTSRRALRRREVRRCRSLRACSLVSIRARAPRVGRPAARGCRPSRARGRASDRSRARCLPREACRAERLEETLVERVDLETTRSTLRAIVLEARALLDGAGELAEAVAQLEPCRVDLEALRVATVVWAEARERGHRCRVSEQVPQGAELRQAGFDRVDERAEESLFVAVCPLEHRRFATPANSSKARATVHRGQGVATSSGCPLSVRRVLPPIVTKTRSTRASVSRTTSSIEAKARYHSSIVNSGVWWMPSSPRRKLRASW
jgi:hypothetical protein